tara:strand:- start:118 stop:273 length:156 start_codon:yes stop_codon:yes gene_type:complete
MLDLFTILLIVAAAYFMGWLRGCESERTRIRRILNYTMDEWEELFKKNENE